MRKLSYVALTAAVAVITHSAMASKSVTVNQADKKFSTGELTISKGDTVVFKNDDPFTHNVYSHSPGIGFELKVQKPGESSEVVFARAGTGEVKCAIHPQMKLRLTVQ